MSAVMSAELPQVPSSLCDHCGVCCRHMVQPPFHYDHEIDRIPAVLQTEILHFKNYILNGIPDEFPCIWLDLGTMKCRHYEHRPDICVEFQMGGEDCLRQRAENGLYS